MGNNEMTDKKFLKLLKYIKMSAIVRNLAIKDLIIDEIKPYIDDNQHYEHLYIEAIMKLIPLYSEKEMSELLTSEDKETEQNRRSIYGLLK